MLKWFAGLISPTQEYQLFECVPAKVTKPAGTEYEAKNRIQQNQGHNPASQIFTKHSKYAQEELELLLKPQIFTSSNILQAVLSKTSVPKVVY